MIDLNTERVTDAIEMRQAYAQALIETARTDDRIVTVDCDLCSSMGVVPFKKAFPERAYNVGIQEANGLCVAAGLSVTGFVPFFNTFGIFASRRVFDQAFVSCAYAGLNVKIVGGDPGVSATTNGGTHMAFEDMGLMRTIPGIRVLDVCDAQQLNSVIGQMSRYHGVEYLRLLRKKVRRIYPEGTQHTIGKANVLHEGTDVTIIAAGLMVHEALSAAAELEKQGISARVVDMFTVKPIDVQCVVESAKRTGAIVTAENHSVTGGLGSAVAEVLAENCPVPLERVGVREEFGEVGPQDYLQERFGLTAKVICERVHAVMKRKG